MFPTHSRSCAIWWLAALSATPSCVGYEPAPLDPEDALAAVLEEPAGSGSTPPFIKLVHRLTESHPRLVRARAAAARDAAVAGIETPLANPGLSGGPVWLSGGGVASSAAWGAQAALSMLIDWRGIRGLNDARLRAVAARSAVESAAAWREEFLDFRGDYLRWALAGREAHLRTSVAEVAERAHEQTRQRIDAGFADALDAALAALNADQAKFAALQSAHQCSNAGVDLLASVGLRSESPADRSPSGTTEPPKLPPLPDRVPSLEELRGRLLDAPDLLRLRARYEIAERQLELAVALQYPPFSLLGSYELENRTHRYNAGGSLPLPLFNRNQQGIAQSTGARRLLYDEFMATLRLRVTRVVAARIALQRALARRRSAAESLDATIEQLEAAIRSVIASGRYDPDRVLTALRRLGSARLQRFGAERTAYEQWLTLERAVGAPLGGLLDLAPPETATTPSPSDHNHEAPNR